MYYCGGNCGSAAAFCRPAPKQPTQLCPQAVVRCAVVWCVCLTAARRHRRDLERVRVGGADGLLFVLCGHFDRLADERQLLAGDHVILSRTVNGFDVDREEELRQAGTVNESVIY